MNNYVKINNGKCDHKSSITAMEEKSDGACEKHGVVSDDYVEIVSIRKLDVNEKDVLKESCNPKRISYLKKILII